MISIPGRIFVEQVDLHVLSIFECPVLVVEATVRDKV